MSLSLVLNQHDLWLATRATAFLRLLLHEIPHNFHHAAIASIDPWFRFLSEKGVCTWYEANCRKQRDLASVEVAFDQASDWLYRKQWWKQWNGV